MTEIKKKGQSSGFRNLLDGRHCFKEMTKLCLNTRTENIMQKMSSIQPWCFWELHVESPWKPDSPMHHRSSPVQAWGHSVYCTLHSHSGVHQLPPLHPGMRGLRRVFHIHFALCILSPTTNTEIPENGVITS